MSGLAETHYLNAEFDLSLRPRPRRLARPSLGRQVREISTLALLGADPGDGVRLRVEVPEAFLEHLAACGVPVPERVDPDVERHPSRLRPFGWNADAMALNQRHDPRADHPPLETLRRVNSRAYSFGLEADEPDRGVVVTDVAEVERVLGKSAGSTEWVVKADHGNAGLGNRRLVAPRLSVADRRFIEGLLAEDDRVALEPWRRRERDWSVIFDVPFDARRLSVHETIGTSDGAFIGAMFDHAAPGPWHEVLAQTAERVAGQLALDGYFGPACLDAFSWHDGERIRLRPLCDLNCRRSMSDGARRLWQRLGAGRAFYYRFFNRRKLTLPADLRPALEALASARYDPQRRVGTLLASPPTVEADGESWRPGKLAVIFAAERREQVFEMEREFRARHEA